MSLLDGALKDDAILAFTAEDDFGEDVVYTSGATSRTISAVVERLPPQPRGDPPRPVPVMRVSVANHATLGILATALDTGKDTITVSYTKGGTAQAFRVHLPEDEELHDAGILNLELW